MLAHDIVEHLQEAGVVEGRNAVIEPRWARGEFNRLPGLAADPAVIVTQTLPAALAAKEGTPGVTSKGMPS